MNPLHDALPPTVRRYVYAGGFVAGIAFSAWNAAQGDWLEFAASVVAGLTSALAGSNVTTYDARHDREP